MIDGWEKNWGKESSLKLWVGLEREEQERRCSQRAVQKEEEEKEREK